MILSNEIEKALYNGECVYKTFNTGYTNTFTIPIPKGSYIILRQIIYYPVVSSNVADFFLRSTLQMSMTEQGSNNEMVYIFRNNINQINKGTIFATDYVYTGGNPQTIETFKVFKKNCCIDIGFGNDPQVLAYGGLDTFTPQATERPIPLGYDNPPFPILESQVNINPLGTINKLYPTGEQRQFVIGPYGPTNRDRLRYDFDNFTVIPNVDTLSQSAGYQFPLFTFGYFEFQTAKSINLQ